MRLLKIQEQQPFCNTRRKVLKLCAVLSTLPLLPMSMLAADLTEEMSAEVFLKLSKELTQYAHIDASVIASMLEVFTREPWGLNHLERLHDKFVGTADIAQALRSLDAGEHWFLGHFLTTYITGIYYHDSGHKVVSYKHALMHDMMSDIRPVPGFSECELGFWADKPDGFRFSYSKQEFL